MFPVSLQGDRYSRRHKQRKMEEDLGTFLWALKNDSISEEKALLNDKEGLGYMGR